MKRLDSRTVAAARPEKRLVLNRETLRRLGAEELEQAAGGASLWPTCGCTTNKAVNETNPI